MHSIASAAVSGGCKSRKYDLRAFLDVGVDAGVLAGEAVGGSTSFEERSL